MTTGKLDIESLAYATEMHHDTQVVKMHDQNEVFCLIVAREISARALRLINNRAITIPNFVLVIQLNMVALQQSKPPGHGYYPFYPID